MASRSAKPHALDRPHGLRRQVVAVSRPASKRFLAALARGRMARAPLAAEVMDSAYHSIARTQLEDQAGKLCACDRCEADGQHEPQCSAHEEPPGVCDCARRTR